MKAPEIAYEAAGIAAARGHCKFTEEDAEGHVCLVGALNIAYCGTAVRPGPFPDYCGSVFDALRMAARILARRRGAPVLPWEDSDFLADAYGSSPITWNNQADITGEDVVLLLKETAAALEEAGL